MKSPVCDSLRRVKEMIQADFVKRRRRSKRRNVAADAGIFRVGPRDHGHRVPANDALDPPLDFDVAGIARLFVGRNRVDVRSIRGERERDSPEVGPFLQVDEQLLKSLRSVANKMSSSDSNHSSSSSGSMPDTSLGTRLLPTRRKAFVVAIGAKGIGNRANRASGLLYSHSIHSLRIGEVFRRWNAVCSDVFGQTLHFSAPGVPRGT